MSVMALENVLKILKDRVAPEFRRDTLNMQTNSLILEKDDTLFAIAYAVKKEYNLDNNQVLQLEANLGAKWSIIKSSFDTIEGKKKNQSIISNIRNEDQIVITRSGGKSNYNDLNDAINRSNGPLYKIFWGVLMPVIKKFLKKNAIDEKLKPEFNLIKQNSGPDKGKTKRVPTGNMISSLTAGSLINLGHFEGSNIEYLTAQAFAQNTNADTVEDITRVMNLSVRELAKENIEINMLTGLNSRMTKETDVDFTKTVTLVFEYSVENQLRGTLEESKIRPAIQKYIQRTIDNANKIDWINQEASDNPVTIMRKKALKIAVDAGFNTKDNIKIDARPSKAETNQKTRIVNNRSKSRLNYTGTGSKKSKTTTIAVPSYLSLINLINQKLPQQIRSNMGGKRLTNRTGKFSETAKVTNVISTPQGYPSIEYNYQKEPYGVFDKRLGKAPWNTPGRDPNELVDLSIRQIAREIGLSRFYTRRQG